MADPLNPANYPSNYDEVSQLSNVPDLLGEKATGQPGGVFGPNIMPKSTLGNLGEVPEAQAGIPTWMLPLLAAFGRRGRSAPRAPTATGGQLRPAPAAPALAQRGNVTPMPGAQTPIQRSLTNVGPTLGYRAPPQSPPPDTSQSHVGRMSRLSGPQMDTYRQSRAGGARPAAAMSTAEGRGSSGTPGDTITGKMPWER